MLTGYLGCVHQDIGTHNETQFREWIGVEATLKPEQRARLQKSPSLKLRMPEWWLLAQITRPFLYWALGGMDMVGILL